MRIAFLLPGLHAVERGAEIAFRSIGTELALRGHDVTLIGSGMPGRHPYRYLRAPAISRKHFESWPMVPPFRNQFRYEELTWVAGLLRAYRPEEYDVAVTCSYPFTNWVIQRRGGSRRPANIFVTENGDWPAYDSTHDHVMFRCDGLVCTNAQYLARNQHRWSSVLIPNGVDPARFTPGPGARAAFGLPVDRPIVLMVSALDTTKRVRDAVQVVSRLDDALLVVAGDGPERSRVEAAADRLLPGRFLRLDVPSDRMPELYRCADAVLHLSLSEAFGNVYLEALATGVPLVAHRTLHTEWLVGDHGELVDTTDLDAVTRALEVAVAAGQDPTVHERIAERFNWSRITDDYVSFFERVLDERAAVGPSLPPVLETARRRSDNVRPKS
jgi:glycosyltransferase involved in cell wall biosynthesis